MENFNLCELLQGCENMKFYSTLYGDVVLTNVTETRIRFSAISADLGMIRIQSNLEDNVFSSGRYFSNTSGECTLFPSKDQRDWSKFKKPIPIDTPVMARDSPSSDWVIRYYAGENNCWKNGFKSTIGDPTKYAWRWVVPVSEFNFNDVESNELKSIC